MRASLAAAASCLGNCARVGGAGQFVLRQRNFDGGTSCGRAYRHPASRNSAAAQRRSLSRIMRSAAMVTVRSPYSSNGCKKKAHHWGFCLSVLLTVASGTRTSHALVLAAAATLRGCLNRVGIKPEPEHRMSKMHDRGVRRVRAWCATQGCLARQPDHLTMILRRRPAAAARLREDGSRNPRESHAGNRARRR